MSDVPVNSSASNAEEPSQKVYSVGSQKSVGFSSLGKKGAEGNLFGTKGLGINFDQVTSNPVRIDKLFTPEEYIPPELLEDSYQALVTTITTHGYPNVETNEAERSMLLHCVLKVLVMYFVKKFDLGADEIKIDVQPSLRMLVNHQPLKGSMDYSISATNPKKTYLTVECKQENTLSGIYQCVAYLMASQEVGKVREKLTLILFELSVILFE